VRIRKWTIIRCSASKARGLYKDRLYVPTAFYEEAMGASPDSEMLLRFAAALRARCENPAL